MLTSSGHRFRVSSVGVTRDSGARIIRENPLEADPHLGRSVGNNDLAGVQRVADSDSAAVME